MEKKFSAKALSYGFPFLDIDGVIPYSLVSSKGVLRALVAVELQLRSTCLFLPFYGQPDGIQDQIHRLLCSGHVSYDTVVIEVTDHEQVQYALLGMNVRYLLPICCWVYLRENFYSANFHTCGVTVPFASILCGGEFRTANHTFSRFAVQYGFRVSVNILAF